jgi:hypothetical protein
MSARTIISARVIPWDTLWGVHIKFSNRKHIAYPVGNRDDAENELRRIRGGAAAQKALA